MRITREILIEAPRERVWAAFDDPNNLSRWQPTLESFRHVEGTAGQPGAVSRLVYLENGRRIEMTETVREREAPELLAGTYDTEFAVNHVENRFLATEGHQTRWVMRADFKFRGWKFRLLSPFIRPAIRKRLRDDMARFKALAESLD